MVSVENGLSQENGPSPKALISVSSKKGIVEFAQELKALGFELLATGGTYKTLVREGIEATEIADYIDFPEMLEGRVKTLHPKIHAGILAKPQDSEILMQHNIAKIDLVVVNLYPFKEVVSQVDVKLDDAIENIDIGGSTLLRAAAKNYHHTTVVTNPDDYDLIINHLKTNQITDTKLRFKLACKAFKVSAEYEADILSFMNTVTDEGEILQEALPAVINGVFYKEQNVRYGENPHQKAALYRYPDQNYLPFAKLQGKPLSYNNIVDADMALACVRQFKRPACTIVKHANPCGVAEGDNVIEAYMKAHACDPTSAFGGIIAFNEPVDADLIQVIIDKQFVELIVVPSITEEAVELIKSKQSVRVLVCDPEKQTNAYNLDYKSTSFGLLCQQHDRKMITLDHLKVVSDKIPSEIQLNNLLFAWKVCKFVKSNAIVYACDGKTIGIGAGQMSRVDSVHLASFKAGENALREATDLVMASDAFLPFADSVSAATAHGVKAIIQPGGSIRDQEVIQAANDLGMVMVFTGVRHFKH